MGHDLPKWKFEIGRWAIMSYCYCLEYVKNSTHTDENMPYMFYDSRTNSHGSLLLGVMNLCWPWLGYWLLFYGLSVRVVLAFFPDDITNGFPENTFVMVKTCRFESAS